jgi:UDP-glucose 4-epimerase
MSILLTGGAGYIGSHVAVELLNMGEKIVLIDNYSNSSVRSVEKIQYLTKKKIVCYEGDVRDSSLIYKILLENKVKAVIHLAGLKSVGESVEVPLEYYSNNLTGTVSILQAMQNAKVYSLVFSSSATVYGEPESLPLQESHPLRPNNPYGRSKHQSEQILSDLVKSNPSWKIVALRYFNPAGAHYSGMLGEMPSKTPNNLMPYIANVASLRLPYLNVYGDDYKTTDGTGVRDYIHVMDLAEGHYCALNFLKKNNGLNIFNLGLGYGYSVLEVVSAFEKVSQRKIRYKIVPRRSGDMAECYSNATKAETLLGWKAKRTLDEMCETSWKFIQTYNQEQNKEKNK